VPERSRWLRNTLIGVAGTIAVVIIVVLAAPLVIPSDFIAMQISGVVRQKTGRDLRIAGPISLSLLPRLTLAAHNVTLASPKGGFSTDFLTAKAVDLALNSIALLHGEIEIDQLRLTQPTISFEIDKSGERNWIFRSPTTPKTTAASPPSSRRAASFAAGDMTLAGGKVTYLDQRKDLQRSASDLNITLSLQSLEGPLSVAGTAAYNGDTVNLRLKVAAPGELRDGRSSAVSLDITSPHESFGFHGTIDGAHPVKASGAVDFKTPSLRDLLAWAQVSGASDDNRLGPLTVAGNIAADGAKLTLADAAITLDDVTAKGIFVMTRVDGKQELDFNDLAVYGGKATGKITADQNGPVPNIGTSVQLTGITVHNLSFNIAGFDTLSGTGDVTADIAGSGKTIRDIVASLNGTGSVNFANGTVGNAGLAPLMKNSVGPLIGNKTVPREIAYRSLTATATIAHGVLHNSDLKLSGPQLSATGAGTLDLASRRIDYLWEPDITGLGNARIAITGTWDNPDYKVLSVNVTKGLAIPGLKPR
jgi:uncharacterized protein involved in outer membrane biogenesis